MQKSCRIYKINKNSFTAKVLDLSKTFIETSIKAFQKTLNKKERNNKKMYI